jgi:SAM-dependent methyltransferase
MERDSRSIIYACAPETVSMADCWYEVASLDHFWIRRRFDVLKLLAGPLIRQADRIAEIGCGNGLVQRCIEDEYGVPVAGFDLNELALKNNISRLSPIYCYDIHRHSPEFHARFDLVLLFDVLEHISDEAAFLRSVSYHMTKFGTLIVNVPANQSLYSNYDRAAGHFRRYSIRALDKVMGRNGLRMRSSTYWGAPLLPLLMVRKALMSFRRTTNEIIASGFDPGSRAMNYGLGQLARWEPIPQKLLGTSLMGVFQKEA